jgi:predicted nucleotidyltransferase component of viral defense system
MNLFDSLVSEALKNQPTLSPIRAVVEKELLHHDILRILSEKNYLKNLTFIGGTCLRTCYGGLRLSEDLDFTSDKKFTQSSLFSMGEQLRQSLLKKYGLEVLVREPTKDTGNVDTWKISIKTKPAQKNLPSQHIHIDICHISSYTKNPMLLINPYGVEMGTSGLAIQAETQEEIYIDKLIAFAMRPNSIKYRDLWDILWLHQKNIIPNLELAQGKLSDRSIEANRFLALYSSRLSELKTKKYHLSGFQKEMSRFLPPNSISEGSALEMLWESLIVLMSNWETQLNSQIRE